MSQVFHRSTNTLSRLSIFGAAFALAGALWGLAAISRSSYVTQEGVARQLARGASADRHPLIVAALQLDAVRHFIPRFHFNRLSRLQVMALDEAQERRVLIGDARDDHRRVHRARQ